MKPISIYDQEALQKQIRFQTEKAWDLEEDFPWHQDIQMDRMFVPLDANNFVFPGASSEQQVVISQILGLMINETICEMECSLPRLKLKAWENILNQYPVNKEMRILGEMFFDEEEKHAKSFQIFFDKFCHQLNIEPKALKSLLPSGFNSQFQKNLIRNAELGGVAFWWTVAAVEETSIQVFRAMQKHQSRVAIDPLYFILHKRHAEEESRHDNYAFMMLDLYHRMPKSWVQKFLSKTDNLLSELLPGPWMITELMKIMKVKKLENDSEFFRVLASCLPLMEQVSKVELAQGFYQSFPYISWLLNPAYRKKQRTEVEKLKVLHLPLPMSEPQYEF